MISHLKALEGLPFLGVPGKVELRPGRFQEEVVWAFRWKGDLVASGLAFAGRGRIRPWLDFDFFPPPEWGRQDWIAFFRFVAEVVGEGGRVMVGYEVLSETLAALQRGVPPILTPLGEVLREAGFWAFKDWYYPEGWAEGGRKLQAERPLSRDLLRFQRLRAFEIREALPALSGPDRERALDFLAGLPRAVRIAGVYLVTDPAYFSSPEEWLRKVEAALAGGVDLVQFRVKKEKHLYARIGEPLRDLVRRQGAAFVVNDDVEEAIRLEADGVHVGGEDLPVEAVKPRFSGFVGGSAYGDLERARALVNAGADYVAFGAVFPSPTKPERPRVAHAVLKQACQELSVPVVAIGGIHPGNVGELLRATGVDAVAVISGILGGTTPEEVRERARRLKTEVVRFLLRGGP